MGVAQVEKYGNVCKLCKGKSVKGDRNRPDLLRITQLLMVVAGNATRVR